MFRLPIVFLAYPECVEIDLIKSAQQKKTNMKCNLCKSDPSHIWRWSETRFTSDLCRLCLSQALATITRLGIVFCVTYDNSSHQSWLCGKRGDRSPIPMLLPLSIPQHPTQIACRCTGTKIWFEVIQVTLIWRDIIFTLDTQPSSCTASAFSWAATVETLAYRRLWLDWWDVGRHLMAFSFSSSFFYFTSKTNPHLLHLFTRMLQH